VTERGDYTSKRSHAAGDLREAKKFALLRDEGILIVGSGQLGPQLHAYAWGRHVPDPFPAELPWIFLIVLD
jgi:hypothetical protein